MDNGIAVFNSLSVQSILYFVSNLVVFKVVGRRLLVLGKDSK